MYIRNANIPDELHSALTAGELVLFVGAGASRAQPSSLPDFKTLARDIVSAAQAGDQIRDVDQKLKQPDTLLGELDDRGVAVHALVTEQLAPPGSVPNALHHAVVRLAAASPAIRIVTTNYDRHLSTAAVEAGHEIQEYLAPALPMGDDFDGIVYLHGSLNQEPRRLVLTDRDFGRAYLGDAWAARFLERMYAKYTVLFIGYSHGDVVLRYLARGLRERDGRYVLTHAPASSDWRPLGLHAIGYEPSDDQHSELPRIVDRWADLASMGLLDHRQRTRELLDAASPSDVPEEMSYLEGTVADPDRLRFFAEFARGRTWLDWVEQQPVFRRVLDQNAVPDEALHVLSRWFCDHYVAVEEHSDDALTVIARGGGRLSPILWNALGQCLHTAEKPRPPWLAPWVTVLAEHAPPGSSHWLEYALNASRWPDDRAVILLLLERLLEPRTTVRVELSDRGRVEIGIPGDAYWLRKAWQDLIQPNLAELASDLLSMADRHLRRLHLLLQGRTSSDAPFDPFTFRRPSIGPHDHNDRDSALDVLVDLARDALIAHMNSGSASAANYIDEWAAQPSTLLRRLAVYGMVHREDASADARVSWVLGRDWLFDSDVRAEVFELLGRSAPELTPDMADRLVHAAAEGPTVDLDPETHAYERFNVLSWLRRHAPDLQGLQQALNDIKSQYPHFAERDHPELTSYIETGWVQPAPPMTADEFHERVQEGPARALADMEPYRPVPDFSGGTTWRDVLALIRQTVENYPRDGFALLDTGEASGHEVTSAILEGWSRASLDEANAAAVLERINELDLSDHAWTLARMLAFGGAQEGHPTDWRPFQASRDLGHRLWDSIEVESVPEVGQGHDWLGQAINHPSGWLAQFWTRVVAYDWNTAGDDWDGIPQPLQRELERLLVDDDPRATLAQPVLASRVRLLYAADPNWTLEQVLPMFTWDDPARSERAWHGYLYWGRPTPPLLNAGLLDGYLRTAMRAETLPDELQDQLGRHFAGIALSGEPEPTTWIARFTASAPSALRVQWIDQVTWMLRDLPDNAVEDQWSHWMKGYWTDRVRGIPGPLSGEEASAIAVWPLRLTDSIQEAVDLAVRTPAGVGHRGLTDWPDEKVDLDPRSIATLLRHLLAHTDGEFWECHRVRELVQRLKDKLPPLDLTPIREEALRLGCLKAAEW